MGGRGTGAYRVSFRGEVMLKGRMRSVGGRIREWGVGGGMQRTAVKRWKRRDVQQQVLSDSFIVRVRRGTKWWKMSW